ncbi:MAG: GerW family sporulation protein [Bacillota bacterium]
MDINTTMDQNVTTLFSNIESFAQDEGTLGKPISLGDKTFIPVISVTLGYGGGNTSGKMTQGNPGTTQTAGGTSNAGMDALGLGARISTDAVIMVDGENVQVMPVSGVGSNMNQLINQIPQLLGKTQGTQQQGQQQGQQQAQSPNQ